MRRPPDRTPAYTHRMAGHEIALTRRIDAPRERVWAVLTDVRHAPRTLSGVDSVDLLTDGPYAVGTRWRETRTMLGRSETQEMWVAENDPRRRTVVRARSGGTDYETVFELAGPEEGPTDLTVRFGAETPEPGRVAAVVWKVFGPLGLRLTRKALASDLDDIATAAQSPRYR